MSNVAIKVENLGKLYQLGEIGTGTVSRDLSRWWARTRGKEDPFAKIGEANDRTQKGGSDFVWSLKDVSFEVQQGEVLGIIGRNGAGKSTLLKILSKVTAPTTGRIKVNGRIASLLEVGTGFHPELTGRENIFLNGAILGMTKTEIRSKFDEMVEFSGVERHIDTPVKRYSSGMYVRLAFAVAAFLEPEILIVDEVLAVGDAEFQKKCLGRMKDVSVNDGRTVLFVSHNLHAIKSLCNSGVYLKNGMASFAGSINETIQTYSNDTGKGRFRSVEIIKGNKLAWLNNVRFISETKENEFLENEFIQSNKPLLFEITIESTLAMNNVSIGIGVNDNADNRIFTLFSRFVGKKYSLKKGLNTILCKIDRLLLKIGIYNLEVYIGNDSAVIDYYDSGLQMEVFPSLSEELFLPDETQGSILVAQVWK